MTIQLPAPVAAYFTADQVDGEAVARCFTDNAQVIDEAHTYKGRAAIQKWKDDASAAFSYTCEPLGCEQQDGKVVVKGRVEGNFPGSPVVLRYLFQLESDRIASLEIVP